MAASDVEKQVIERSSRGDREVFDEYFEKTGLEEVSGIRKGVKIEVGTCCLSTMPSAKRVRSLEKAFE